MCMYVHLRHQSQYLLLSLQKSPYHIFKTILYVAGYQIHHTHPNPEKSLSFCYGSPSRESCIFIWCLASGLFDYDFVIHPMPIHPRKLLLSVMECSVSWFYHLIFFHSLVNGHLNDVYIFTIMTEVDWTGFTFVIFT